MSKQNKKFIEQIKKAGKKTSREGYFSKEQIENLFKNNPDVHFQTFAFEHNLVTFITCEGMVDIKMINNVIYERFVRFFDKYKEQTLSEEDIISSLYVPGLQRITEKKKVISDVFLGKLFVLFHNEQLIFSIDIADRPQRQPEETSTEISIKGPRDDFIEDIDTNIALIRKRLRTNSLAINRYVVGKRTQTQVALLYIDDIINMDIIKNIDQRLKQVNVDGIYSGTQLKEILSERAFNFFPVYHYSGRPDFAVQSLLTGRFLLLVDGVQYVVIAPVNLAYILKSAEDSESVYLFNSFERLIRLFGLVIAVFVPGLWVALISFHQNQIPIAFLGTIIESRQGVPLPASLEAILMVFLFEFFREAGLRLPLAIGSTLSVVGGLIIGEAAIRAGLASPMMIVVMATSSVATYTLVSMSLHGVVSILRLFVIIFASFFGLFGFFVSIFLIVLYIANMETYGVSYLSIPEEIRFKEVLKTIFRLPESKYEKRPSFLRTKDDTIKPPDDKG